MIRTFLTVVLVSVALSAAAFADGPGTQFNIKPLVADGQWNNRASLDVDDDGVKHLVWAAQTGTDSSTAEVYYANNAADGEWAISQLTFNNVWEEFPCLTLDADGNVHVAVHTGIPGGNHVRYTNNVGAPPGEFNDWINITPPTSPFYVIVEVRIDSQGTVHFTFRTQTPVTGEDVYYTTWSARDGVAPLVNLSNTPGAYAVNSQIAVGPDDAVHVIWSAGIISGPLMYRKKLPGEDFVAINTGVPGSVTDPMILIDDDNRVSMIYRQSNVLYLVESGNGGEDPFSSPKPLFTEVTALPAFYERFALDADGHRHVAFSSNSQELRGVWYIGETDDGWGKPTLIDGDDTGNQGTSIAVGPDGEVVVAYSLSGFDQMVFADLFLATRPADDVVPGDLNEDGVVDGADLLLLLAAWGECDDPNDCPADLNDDGSIDGADLLILLSNWG